MLRQSKFPVFYAPRTDGGSVFPSHHTSKSIQCLLDSRCWWLRALPWWRQRLPSRSRRLHLRPPAPPPLRAPTPITSAKWLPSARRARPPVCRPPCRRDAPRAPNSPTAKPPLARFPRSRLTLLQVVRMCRSWLRVRRVPLCRPWSVLRSAESSSASILVCTQ